MTILTIAHRLSSIRQAKNLLFIESRNKVTWHRQGTASYEEALNRLKNVNHAYANGEAEEEEIDKLSSTLLHFKSAASLKDSEITEAKYQEIPGDSKLSRVASQITNDQGVKRAETGRVATVVTAPDDESDAMTVFSDVDASDSEEEEE